MKRLFLSALAAVALCAAAPANASTYLFDEVGDNYSIALYGEHDGVPIDGLGALLSLSLVDIVDDTNFILDYSLVNTSGGNTLFSRLTGIGWDIVNNPFTASIISGPLFDNIASGQISNGTFVEFCVVTNNSCSGGGGDGLVPLMATNGRLRFDTSDTVFGLSNVVARAQSINTVDGMRGGSGILRELNPPAAVPEPTTWALMILGFGGAGAMLRRHRLSKQSIMLA